MREPVPTAPRVSAVICTNKCDAFFDLALKSIEQQSFDGIEIVVAANGMNDAEFDRLVQRAAPRAKVLRTSIGGVTFSRNLVLDHCSAPLVAVLDADDIAYPERIARQVEFMDGHPEVAVCSSDYDLIDQDGKTIRRFRLPSDNAAIRSALVWSNPICNPAVIFRRDIVAKLGGYTGFSSEDYELWVRLLEDPNIQFANIPESLLGYRIPVVSVVRRSRRAYAHVAGAQLRMFILTGKPKWLAACILSVLKAWFRATRA